VEAKRSFRPLLENGSQMIFCSWPLPRILLLVAARMKWVLILSYVLMTNPATLLCRELSGTVYSDHSGPSGHGTGMLRLATQNGVINVYYQKPIRNDFSKIDTCWQVGAIWTVWTSGSTTGEQELIKAHCTGELNEAVHAAWLATKDYIEAAAREAGYAPGFKVGRRGPLEVDMNGLKVDVFGFLSFGMSGMCLEMKQRVDPKTIIVGSSADCYFWPELDFTVEQIDSTIWQVKAIKAVGSTK
jgi:hypothetical protein